MFDLDVKKHNIHKFKGAMSQGFRGFWAQTILKLVVANLIHAERQQEEPFAKSKQTTAINTDFFQDAWKQLEMFSLIFSSCNPFPSWPSAAKDTC